MTFKQLIHLAILIPVLACATGCGIKYNASYDSSLAKIPYETKRSVALGVQDQRPYVVSGEKAPNYAGVTRGSFGNPFDVSTKGEKPLAEIMAEAVQESFRANGIKAQTVMVSPKDSESQAIKKLSSTNADKLVLIFLKEWKTDTMFNTTELFYDLGLEVFDHQGKKLASKALKGEKKFLSNVWAISGGSLFLFEEYRKVFKALWDDPGVEKALRQ